MRSTPDAFPPRDRRRERRARARRVVSWVAGIVLVALLAAAGWVAAVLVRSRPLLDGELRLAGLQSEVQIERDTLGVPTIRARDRSDAAFALGFLHAQERFFQMDLLRRAAAGELAALLGGAALELDRTLRVHRFRDRARRSVETQPRVAMLEAYARGVNAGLDQLGAAPFEYLLLRTTPEAWRPEDTILVVLAMYLDLQPIAGELESSLGALYDTVPRAVADFLAPRGTSWDAPLVGEAHPLAPLPNAATLDLRRRSQSSSRARRDASSSRAFVPGSNSWAVAGSLCVGGGALLAGDMHLALRVPNIWYRASLTWTRPSGQRWTVTGVTLPGTPTVVSGSNGHVAWAFTNSMIDVSDLVVLEPAGQPQHHTTPDGAQAIEVHAERIDVRGGATDTLHVRETIWGPIIDRDHAGRERAYRWIAHDAEAVNLGLLDMETADSLETALDAAHRTRIPTQNCLIADARGRIAWTLMGPIPKRFGWDGRVPTSWADGTRGWSGTLAPHEYPRVVDPPHGRLWTANARVLSGADLQRIGDGGYVLGARAQQIRDALFDVERATPGDMLRIQLDDRAVFLERWHALLLRTLTKQADGRAALDSARVEMRGYVESWGGRAAVHSVGYRIVRAFRAAVLDAALEPLLVACREREPRLRLWHLRHREGVVWALVETQPLHLLDPRYDDWPALLAACADSTLVRLQTRGPLRDRTWGEHNTSRIRHPLTRAVPFLSRWLDMPPRPLPGDSNMPRVQATSHGASQRFVVSPGREDEGFFHMPGGQSGHPLSPFYRNSHRSWEEGDPTPFLPGATRHSLVLKPSE